MIAEHLTRHENERTVIRVQLRQGVWEVTRDGTFFGDYLQRSHAMEAAKAAAASFQALGGVAEIDASPNANDARRQAREAAR